MKTRNQVYLIAAMFITLMIVDAVVKKPAEIQASEQTGSDESVAIPDLFEGEYENWMKKAESSANNGLILYVKAELKLAEWCVNDANIPGEYKAVMLKDLSERTKAIMLKLHKQLVSDGLMNALRHAYGCDESLMRDYLKGFTFYSLKVGMEPDGKIKKVREILAASFAESEKLSEN